MNLVNKIMDYEDGNLTEAEVIELFQELLDTGTIHHLQGHYQRTLKALMDQGLVFSRGDGLPRNT